MSWRCLVLSFCLLFGCQSIEPKVVTLPTTAREAEDPGEVQQVQHTQPTIQPLGYADQILLPNPTPSEPDWLNKASIASQAGDDRAAADYLLHHLALHPDHLLIRLYAAELLNKCKEWLLARYHFEKFIEAAQDNTGEPHKQLIHVHTRLMEIAQKMDDEYGEHLHRGIGMVLLEKQLSEAKEPKGEEASAFRERILCKGVTELEKAHTARPDEARPCWYLYEAWSKLDRVKPAQCALRETEERKDYSLLTPAEARSLALAER